jgi:hypothetical protein
MRKLDEEFKNKNFDINYKDYINVLKDKKIKTKYAYYIGLNTKDKNQVPMILNLAYSIKYEYKTKYDLVILIQNKPFYEKDYLNNYYIKYDGIDQDIINDIMEIFDVVLLIDPNTISKRYRKKSAIDNDLFNLINNKSNKIIFSYTEYQKILKISEESILNKSIDYLFDLYNKSVYTVDYNHYDYTGGLKGAITLIEPKKYYIFKTIYLINNFKMIFKNLNFFISKTSLISYYTIFPNWNDNKFDKFIINYNYNYEFNINLYSKYYDNFDIEYYEYFKPSNFFIDQKHINKIYNFDKRSKFNLNLINYKKWDLMVKKLLEKFPNFAKYFDYIKTYRNVNF